MAPSELRDDPPPDRRKSTLVCQRCGRERHLEGDWLWCDDGDRVAVCCPDCGNVLTRRPRSGDGRPDGGREREPPLPQP